MEREHITQRERIERYYNTLLEQGSNELSPDVVTYILLGIGMMLLFVPVQEMLKERDLFAVVWCATMLINMAIIFYISKYSGVGYGNNKAESVTDVLVYMPFDHKIKRKFLFGKLLKILIRITIAGLIMQLGVALIVYHTISVWNAVYALGITFIVPLIFGWLPFWLGDFFTKKK